MPPTTVYNFGDLVLVPFPFTDQTGAKKRPAVVVVSSATYNAARRDIVLMAVTSQVRAAAGIGEVVVSDWQKAGLLKASVIKPVLTTVEKGLILRTLGQLGSADQSTWLLESRR
ncbi:MAG TPA: type II toxin-antitoxin system PemK/MazF family toxin [Pyrinomonadaceae bacterium]|jgi:mRNA interferase MazF